MKDEDTNDKEFEHSGGPGRPGGRSGGPGGRGGRPGGGGGGFRGGPGRGPGGRGGGFRGGPRSGGGKFGRKKYCRFSADHVEYIDYKNYRQLREMLTERGKIKPRSQTGTNAKYQRMLNTAIKRARFMALISPTKL